MENSPGHQGIRILLKNLREDDDPELIAQLTRPSISPAADQDKGPKHIVYFQVEKGLKLIAGKDK